MSRKFLSLIKALLGTEAAGRGETSFLQWRELRSSGPSQNGLFSFLFLERERENRMLGKQEDRRGSGGLGRGE